MRVLFLTPYPEQAASPRYRVHQFLPYLRQRGMDCAVACAVTPDEYAAGGRPFWYHAAETPRRLKQLLQSRRYDIVFVQKAILSAYLRGMLGLLRCCARRLVYDFDDAVHLSPPHSLRGVWRCMEDRQQVRRLIPLADKVLAGNTWLAAEAERLGGKASVFPTVVDTARFHPAPAPDTYRLGWIGGPSTTPALDAIGLDLARLEGVSVTLIGADPWRAPWPEAEVRDWSLDTEVADVQQFSVGLMPLPKTEWSRGKCALKALQYMACGVPCIATPFGAVLDIIRHGENGLFADSPGQWRDAIELLRDPCVRARMGEAARATVEQAYALDTAAPRLAAELESMA